MAGKAPHTPLEKRLGLNTLSMVADTLVAGAPEPFELIEHGGRYTLIVHNHPDAVGIEDVTIRFKSVPSAMLGSFKSEAARQQIARLIADDVRLLMQPLESVRGMNQLALFVSEFRCMTDQFLKRISLSFGKRFTR